MEKVADNFIYNVDNKQEKNKNVTLENVAVSSAQYETVQRYGAAVKEHIKAYSGIDNETGEINENFWNTISG